MKIYKLKQCLISSFFCHALALIFMLLAHQGNISLHSSSVLSPTIQAVAKEKQEDLNKANEKPIVQAVMVNHQEVAKHVVRIKNERKAAKEKEMLRHKKLEDELRRIRAAANKERQHLSKIQQKRKQQMQKLVKAEKDIQLAQSKKADVQNQIHKTQKAYNEELNRIHQQRMKLEQEAKVEEEMLKQQVVMEKKIRSQLAAEKQKEQEALNKQVHAEISKYRAMIQSSIQRHLILQESMRHQECVVRIQLAEDGFVTDIKKISGNQVVCRQAIAAIHKSKRLPISPNPHVYNAMKNINLTIKPEFN